MKKLILLTIAAALTQLMPAQTTLNVWPDGPTDNNGADNEATITVYTPPTGTANSGKALVICPGGGYEMLAMDHEGHEMARMLAEHGITGVVLKYRLPNGHHNIPADDAREAIRIVRRHASEWGINSDKVGISGFSAGGHLASTVLTHPTDSLSTPSFGVLIYPVISARPGLTHDGSAIHLLGDKVGMSRWVQEYSNDEHVNATTPPTILLLSSDDTTVWPDNSIRFFQAMVRNNVETEMHVYPVGNHGWGMRASFPHHKAMTASVLDWIDRR